MRVAIVGSPSQLNTSYRVMQPAQALKQQGHSVLVWLAKEGELDARSLAGFDAVYVYRYMSRPTQALLQRLREDGTALVWDNDDDLTVSTSHTSASRKRGAMRSQQVASLLRSTLSLADVATTTNAHLQRFFLDAGAADVRVLENYVASEFATAPPPRPRDDDAVVVGWTAALEHAHELERLGLRPVLRRLLDTHPHVRVETVGIVLDLDRERSHAHGFVRFEELPALVSRFDVGIAPLVDDEFNRARSNIKLKEYASLGIPWLASPIGPYAGLGEREGGRLVPDGHWYEELERMVTHPRLRRRLAKRARRWAGEQVVERHASRWVEVFEDAVRRRREPSRPAEPALASARGRR